MTNDKNILIKNIYYMLAYAFQVLKRNMRKSCMRTGVCLGAWRALSP